MISEGRMVNMPPEDTSRFGTNDTWDIDRHIRIAPGEGWVFPEPELVQAAPLTMDKNQDVGEKFRELAVKLTRKHPRIGIQKDVSRGFPHIKGTRLTVGDALSYVTMLGSVEAAANELEVDPDKIRDALTFARSFLNTACAPVFAFPIERDFQEVFDEATRMAQEQDDSETVGMSERAAEDFLDDSR